MCPTFTKFLHHRLTVYFFGAVLTLGPANAPAQSNGVLREVFYNINGGSVSDLTNAPSFPNKPDEYFIDGSFEAPSNFADFYGQRMRALVSPPVTGSYVFFVSSDDSSVLYLSTDETPAHKVQIASVDGWTPSRAWNMYPSEKSAAVRLTNGARYYIEAMQKDGSGGDNLAVAWQKPGDPAPADGSEPIPGTFLMPFGLSAPIITLQPASLSVVEGGTALFKVELAQSIGAKYQWQRGSTNISEATNAFCLVSPVLLGDSGTQFRCMIVNAYGSTNSATATLTVVPDRVKPMLSSAGSLGEPTLLTVIFTKALEAASATSATNYAINGGITVLSASFGADARTVILVTTPMVARTPYVLTVSNVRDLATTPNTIPLGSQCSFKLDSPPLDVAFVRPPSEPIGPSTRHGPIVISEIMYHPSQREDGKNLQYIEIYNSHSYFQDISGFKISGEIDYFFPTNSVIPGRGYIVIAAAPADLQSVYGTAVFGQFGKTLSKSSGTIRLLNRQGGIAFETSYSNDTPWPAAADGGGHSLVLARPSLGAKNPAAWGASDRMGGTPGWADIAYANPYRTVVINEILARSRHPDLDFIELYNYSSEPVDISSCVLTDDPATNKFVLPTNTVIQPQGMLCFNETELGFKLSAGGGSAYFIDTGNSRVVDALRFGPQETGVSLGRYPDGAASFRRLKTKTPGEANGRPRVSDVVINEIMYDPVSGESNDQFVELFNHTGLPVNVSRWRLEDGIKYTIPEGAVIPANGFLVIARNTEQILKNHPNLAGGDVFGNFTGSLAHGGERLALAMPEELKSTDSSGRTVTNMQHVVVDEVTYGTGGRWGQWAHGGGSSLELIDPRADHSQSSNWADSDESGKSAWVTIEATGVLDNGNGDAGSLNILLLGPGECLVDNVEVMISGKPNLIANPSFEAGLDGWVPQGNHEDSGWESAQGYNSAHCLHIRASDHGDTGANRIRTTLTTGLNPGQTATIRAKVRWLAGHPEILFRLHGNWLEATGNMLTSRDLGTPGSPNLRGKPNAGPAISDVKHWPVLPGINQNVTIVARVNDPDRLAGLVLKYRMDPSTNLVLVTMTNSGAGVFSASIPGQAAGKLAAFHIQATDDFSPRSTTYFPNDAPARECLVRWGDPATSGNFGTYRLWMTQATMNRWSSREHLSNKPLDCTFVYGNSRVVYNMGGQYSGSPWHAPGFNTPIGNVCDYLFTFPEDDPLLGETAATLQWPGNGGGDNSYQREQTAYWIAEQIGLPFCYRRSVNLLVNGVRRAEFFEDAQQPSGDMADEFYPEGENGDLHKVQIWYEFDNAATIFSGVGASLGNTTTTGGKKKLAVYRWTFAKRAVQGSASNYTNLFALVDAANFSGLGANYRNQLESTIEVDNWLKTYAVEHVVGNSDSFAYGGGQNMYIYKPLGDTWKMMIWDIDFAFAAQPATSDVFQGIGRSCGIDLREPAYMRRYWQILQDLAEGPLSAAKANPLIDARYNAMLASGRTVDNPAGIKNYISQERTYLLGLISSNVSSPFSITLNSGASFSTNRNMVTLTGTAPVDVRTITINGIAFPVTWTSVRNWTAQVALNGGINTLTIQGWTAQNNLVTGATASISIRYTGIVDPPQGNIVLNEIMYNPWLPNTSYIELFNASASTAFDLSGWRLSEAEFTFPGGTIIGPGAFVVIAADKLAFAAAYNRTIPVLGEFHGKLNSQSETVRLIKPGATSAEDTVVSEAFYDSRAPWPAAASGAGASLQLIDPYQENNRVANWSAIATNVPWPGGIIPARATPGALNSVRAQLAPLPSLWINEVLPNNSSGPTDRFGHRHPWVEIYNNGPTNLDLSGLFLANNYTNLTQWRFPGGTTLGAKQFLVVWLGDPSESASNELHASVTIPLDTGSLALVRTNSTMTNILDYLNYAGVPPDRSQGSFPDGAPYQRQIFFYVTPGASNNPASRPLDVVINEWMADNSTLLDPADDMPHDWFELYNPSSAVAELSGFYLGTSLTNTDKFPIPNGWKIPPYGHLVVWADDLSESNNLSMADLHVNFKLSRHGESIGLFASDGTVVDFVTFGEQATDVSQGRYPDGAASIFALTAPTPSAANYLVLPNTPPVIEQITNRVLIQGQLLTCNVAASDSDMPEQTLTFGLEPGSPVGAAINPETGLLSWRASAPGSNTITVRVSDSGSPSMSTSIAFTVEVAPLPRVTSIVPSGRLGYSISFVTVPGKTYGIEFKNALEESAWQPLNSGAAAVGNTFTVDVEPGGSAQRFYRIVVLE